MNRHSHWSDQLGQAQRPAFQAVHVTSALELHAAAGTAFSGWGCDVRGAERRACRLKPAFQTVARCRPEAGAPTIPLT